MLVQLPVFLRPEPVLKVLLTDTISRIRKLVRTRMGHAVGLNNPRGKGTPEDHSTRQHQGTSGSPLSKPSKNCFLPCGCRGSQALFESPPHMGHMKPWGLSTGGIVAVVAAVGGPDWDRKGRTKSKAADPELVCTGFSMGALKIPMPCPTPSPGVGEAAWLWHWKSSRGDCSEQTSLDLFRVLWLLKQMRQDRKGTLQVNTERTEEMTGAATVEGRTS